MHSNTNRSSRSLWCSSGGQPAAYAIGNFVVLYSRENREQRSAPKEWHTSMVLSNMSMKNVFTKVTHMMFVLCYVILKELSSSGRNVSEKVIKSFNNKISLFWLMRNGSIYSIYFQLLSRWKSLSFQLHKSIIIRYNGNYLPVCCLCNICNNVSFDNQQTV